ncbi:MAG: prepilin-type N-terminal cleavage/methylation domain-containing protein [Spirulina sp. SIO3F2]|nr:prepilin-type N-terminal cleavage/methylation domain-containing protein [Spirulina sp. SIO3F2]
MYSRTISQLKHTLRWLLQLQLKRSAHRGFTLIELLVGLIIAVLVMIPLLSLAVNLISTDRREQAKAITEQDLQAAADFIARDLQQAIYIYDSVALTRDLNINDEINSGIRDQIPPVIPVTHCNDANLCIPALAFWTRRVVEDGSPIGSGNTTQDCTIPSNRNFCDDTFVYSFVAYYLILAKANPEANPVTNSVWSDTARIGRFEVSAGVTNGGNELVELRLSPAQSVKERDAGYGPFDLSLEGDDIRSKMNRWDGAVNSEGTTPYPAEAYDNSSMQILVDNIDNTTIDIANREGETLPRLVCPAVDNGTGAESQKSWIQSPYYGSPNPAPNPAPTEAATQFRTYSFYACVNSEQSIAKIFLRGNALSKIRTNHVNSTDILSKARNIFFYEKRSALFPTVSAEVQLEGRLFQ